MYTILGFSKFKSKKGNMCTVMQLSREFNTRELEAGSIGVRVEEVFLPDDHLDIAIPQNVGKECVIAYNRNGFLDNLSIVG